MAISAHGDSLLALDPGSLTVFGPSGDVRSRRPLADTVTCNFPRVHPAGRWAASCVLEATAEQVLTYRRSDGGEQRRVASYDLGEFYPGIPPGGPFWINGTQVRDYLYDFTPDGRLLWAVSDRARILITQDGVDQVFFETKASAVPFPADQITTMRTRQRRLKPPLFMNVPDNYQLVQHLVVDESGDVWMYLLSQERTGLLRLSPTGEEKEFHTVEADFDMLSARLAACCGRLYFMVSGENETAVYSVEVPGK
jgi:hypothetical protein